LHFAHYFLNFFFSPQCFVILLKSSCSEQLKTELWPSEVFNSWLLAAFFSRLQPFGIAAAA